MQEGQGQPGPQKVKSPETSKLIEQLEELVEKIVNSGVKKALDYAEGKSSPIEKQSAEEIFEKYKTPGRSKEMSAEMKEKCYMWATRVKTYGDGTTNEYEPNMAIGNHPEGEFLLPKSKKSFKVEDYPMFTSFLDLKKLASHPYGYVISRMREEVDHFRVEFASRILFHEMNQDRDEAIRKSEAVRLSKPSSLLLSPYCQIDSDDIYSDLSKCYLFLQ
ncbi:hypothetical protein Ahy_A03g014419 [Arachis hypogaea]|uniref:Uncharacterized protein n=1 Tax=Arachis hypogaea TaxID=3818 RepID=A0A445DXM6_ARAHY|nr:hypothetical protein Ahy_A03g014419 [Arachis hypogaea]